MKTRIFLAAAFGLLMLASFVKAPAKLFLLGDSISLQYKPYLQTLLKNTYVIEQKNSDSSAFKNLDIPVGSNGGDSRMVLKFITQKVAEPNFKPDMMLLNCGLHDVKRDPKSQKIAVDAKEYRSNLEKIQQLLAGKKIPLIWIRTTGIIDSIHRKNKGFDRYLKDIEQYNTIADEVFKSHGVPEIDLFTFTAAQGNDRFVDHAHYQPSVRAKQAAYIAGSLEMYNQSKH